MKTDEDEPEMRITDFLADCTSFSTVYHVRLSDDKYSSDHYISGQIQSEHSDSDMQIQMQEGKHSNDLLRLTK